MSSPSEDDKNKKKKSAQKCAFGGLPTNIEDIQEVTSVASQPDVARSVDAFSPFAPSAPVGFGPTNFGPTPSFPGAKTVGAGPTNKNIQGAKAAPATSNASVWNITEESLPMLPDFHPLERTAVFVPHTAAAVVASRVHECLRERSITSEYNDEKARVKCVSPENVEFRVRLYRGKGRFDHGVITEVQRRYNFSVAYNSDVVAILHAAEGKPIEKKKPLPGVSDTEDDAEEVMSGTKRKGSMLRIASDMLKKSRTADANIISMLSLTSLTDSSSMGTSTALRVSTQILEGTEESGGFEIRDAVLSLLVNNRLASDTSKFDGDTETLASLRLSAMTILTNVVTELQKGNPSVLKDQGPVIVKAVLPVLVKEIKGAEANARMATLSCRCLCALVVSVDGVFETQYEKDAIIDAVYSAKDVGQSRHAALAKHAGDCIAALTSR